MTADDLPGETFQTVPGSGSVNVDRGGRTAATYVPSADSSLKEGFVPADASCSWVGGSGITAGLTVLDYSDQPDLLAAPIEGLVVGAPVEEHRLLTVDGFDQMAVAEASNVHTLAAAIAGPYVLTAHAAFFDGDEEQLALFLEQLFSRWHEAATTVSG